MKLTNERLGCSFDVPDRPTVRQQLEYFALVMAAYGKDALVRYWDGAKTLITNWQCEKLSDTNVDLDQANNPIQAQIILWAALKVKAHMSALEDIEKN